MNQETTPYLAHVFVCTNDRGGERKSCADNNSVTLRAALKAAVAANGWQGVVRVSASGCLGRCGTGPNVMVYPQGFWFQKVRGEDVDGIVAVLKRIVPDPGEE